MATSLPIVLIGPVLRRVEARQVSVFVALRETAVVHLSVYEGVVDATSPPAELAGGDADTLRFGECFHAVVVVASLDALPLQPGQRYSYDLRLKTADGQVHTLQSLLLLKDHTVPGYRVDPPDPTVEVCAIGYAENQLPSFVTPPAQLEELVMAHASCRKPHGAGHPALQYLDEHLDDLDGATAGWLHRLFLTGDQIYADDVATALLPGLNTLGIALVSGPGGDLGVEAIPAPRGDGALKVNTITLPAGFRQKTIGLAGFSTESGASHLIGFGEWLAMYCIAWNPDVWPVLAVADTRAPDIGDKRKAALLTDVASSPGDAPIVLGLPSPDAAADFITPLHSAPEEAQAALQAMRDDFAGGEQKALLDAYRREVPKVRRLLANVPTYMAADDHEVTDDWFITRGVREASTSNPAGRAILRNGMTALAICQGWGNDPAAWALDGDRHQFLAQAAAMFGPAWTEGLPVATASGELDRLLGLSPQGEPAFDFSFQLQGPGHRVQVLDTRTRRKYRTLAGSPALLTDEALARQLPEDPLPEGDVLVVVSPVPVIGPAVMTELGGVLAASEHDISSFARRATERATEQQVTGLNQGRPLGSEAYDAEHWGADPAALERLLQRLARHPRVVVLAGDVHYAAAFAMDWSDAPPGGDAPRHSRMVHLTSSAARNGWMQVVRNLMMLNGMSVGLQRIGMPIVRIGWQQTLPPVLGALGEEPPLPRVRLQTAPVLLGHEMFRRRHVFTRPAEWAWVAHPLADERPSAERPKGARMPDPGGELPEGDAALSHYAKLASVHAKGLGTAAIARGLQFLSNVGIVRFERRADGLHVSQSLLSLRPKHDPGEKAADYVLHSARLEPVPVPMPVAVGPEA